MGVGEGGGVGRRVRREGVEGGRESKVAEMHEKKW